MTYPYQGMSRWELTPDQLKERTEWMADEARRLTTARAGVQRPAKPVTMEPVQSEDELLTEQLQARMREVDRRNYGE